MAHSDRFFVGAYAASPSANGWSKENETAYFEGLRRLPRVGGLELPFFGSLHPHDPDWLLQTLDPAWDIVLTMIPGVMQHLASDPDFGLASEDEAGRWRAIDYCSLALETVSKIVTESGRRRVLAVEIHSAPTLGPAGVQSSTRAFTESLRLLRSWDWKGASLLVEHCDAYIPGQSAAKGFLSIEDELTAIQDTDTKGATDCAILINWGRSAIEGRDATEPSRHLAVAREAGKLGGVIFSGATVNDPLYGNWSDSHAPFDAKGSILRGHALEESLKLALTPTPAKILGLKMQSLPKTLTVRERIAFVERQIAILEEATFNAL